MFSLNLVGPLGVTEIFKLIDCLLSVRAKIDPSLESRAGLLHDPVLGLLSIALRLNLAERDAPGYVGFGCGAETLCSGGLVFCIFVSNFAWSGHTCHLLLLSRRRLSFCSSSVSYGFWGYG